MIQGVATQWSRIANGGLPNGDGTSGGGANGGATSGGSSNGGSSSGAGRSGDSASQHAHGSLAEERPAGADAERGGLWGALTSFFGSLTRRQWLTYGGIAAGFFLVVVAGITVFELTIGKPVGSLVYNRPTSGTSVGDTLSGSGHSSPKQKATTHPSSSPSATPTGSTPASPTPSAPTSSGTPTPSTSVAPASPSTLPSATPSTGATGAARSATTATPTP